MKKILITIVMLQSFCFADSLYEKLKLHKKNYILFFYTTWCPACEKSTDILNEIAEKYPNSLQIVGINIEDNIKRKNFFENKVLNFMTLYLDKAEAVKYGVEKSIPVIYILNSKKQIIKKYFETPRKSSFLALIDRLQKGFLANGTLPIEQRVDLWKKERN